MQFKLHIVILDWDWLKGNRKYSKPMISRKMTTKILCRDFEKSFLEGEKMTSRKIFRHFSTRIFSWRLYYFRFLKVTRVNSLELELVWFPIQIYLSFKSYPVSCLNAQLQKFDVLIKTSIFSLEVSLLVQIFVLRTSNFRGQPSADSSSTETLDCSNR